MTRRCSIIGGVAAISFVGCAPIAVPLPQRLTDVERASITDEWVRVLDAPRPVGRQALLDLLLLQCVYYFGMDRIDYRAEKDLASGRLVIEVHADAAHRDADSLTLTRSGPDGSVVRVERWTRAEVERTSDELGSVRAALRARVERGAATDAERDALLELDARVSAAAEFRFWEIHSSLGHGISDDVEPRHSTLQP